MKRIYHHYLKWEDYKNGFYDNCKREKKQYYISKVIELFNDKDLTKVYMEKVINDWFYSCEHNLTNDSMNRIAYIGQAACCIYAGVPCDVTMRAWKILSQDVRNRSDIIAKKTIKKWELKKKSDLTYQNGKKKDMKKEYQMKLPFN